MAFQKTDGGRAQSRRKKQRNDCVVRALALVADLPYDDAFDICAGRGRKPNSGQPKIHEFLAGLGFEWISFPAVAGGRRMTAERFAGSYPTGRFILRQAGHVCACIDGVVMDEFEPGERCVYGAWRLEK